MKRRSNAGFTLAETLMATLILLLISLIMANGVPIVMRAYERVVVAGNARLLMSTTISVLRDELSTARNIQVDETAGTITYFSMDRGAECQIYLNGPADAKVRPIWIDEYRDKSTDPNTPDVYLYKDFRPKPHALVTVQSGNKGDKEQLVVSYKKATLESGGMIKFEDLAVYRSDEVAKDNPTPVDLGRMVNPGGGTETRKNKINLAVRIIMPIPSPTPTSVTPVTP